MPRTALAVTAVYLALAFGLRALVHYRRTGTTGYVGLGGDVFSVEWCAGVLFAIAVAAGVAAPLLQIAGVLRPWTGPGAAAGHALGLGLALAGIAGTLAAQLAMGTSWRIGVDRGARTELVSRGPFRFVRNPIFTWMACASFGLALLAPNVLAAASFAALVLALEIQVRGVEEPYLLRTHGEAYRRYAAATGRFLPGIGRLG
jgi:protein-S-isoprenylcysteine O-methyltransferase Ste14